MSDKTEPPSPKRIRDARAKGNVPKSTDVNSAVLIIGLFTYISMNWEKSIQKLCQLILTPSYFFSKNFDESYQELLWKIILQMLSIILAIGGVVVLLALVVNFAQVGVLFTTKPLLPDINRINPASKLKQIFSKKNLFELGKSIIKILSLSTLIFLVIKNVIHDLLLLPRAGIKGVLELLPAVLKRFSNNVILVYIIFAAIDFVFQRRNWTNQLKMSKDEVKREYKESEGDPQIKGKRKQIHREMIEQDPPQRTKGASALVTNPAHMAIALLYEPEKQTVPFPMVLAKGIGVVAEQMIAVAKKEGIPIMRNVPLAHALMDMSTVLDYIPRELMQPVAEVLRWVYVMRERQAQGQGLDLEGQVE
ncbi:MAG: type III secretion system export apparatus subunit SctU [Puniceicoccales bacterium]|jgi:type III secretion protein U|nr:type III secretion system export apparatus subunit SctU [Puniceicoccales bacterium]